MKTKAEIVSTLKELKPLLKKEYSVKEIGLFGSFADDSYTDSSDIDIIVDFDKPIGWKFFSLEIYFESILGRKIDLVTKNALKSQIRDSILKKVQYI